MGLGYGQWEFRFAKEARTGRIGSQERRGAQGCEPDGLNCFFSLKVFAYLQTGHVERWKIQTEKATKRLRL